MLGIRCQHTVHKNLRKEMLRRVKDIMKKFEEEQE